MARIYRLSVDLKLKQVPGGEKVGKETLQRKGARGSHLSLGELKKQKSEKLDHRRDIIFVSEREGVR